MSSEQSELEIIIDGYILNIRASIDTNEEQVELEKGHIIALAESYEAKEIAQILELRKPKELLPIQWELEEIIEALDPADTTPEEDDDDDPCQRRLRASELELVYSDPRGLQLFTSKVDDRWVVMQMDPYTGGMTQKEIPGDQAEHIKRQLAGSPYWVRAV